MKKKLTKELESNVAELIIVTMFIMILLSSCGTGHCVQNEWATPLKKQYSRTCN